MKGLAWDDEPKYMRTLATHLQELFGIELRVEEKLDDFVSAFVKERWDFVVTDLIDSTQAQVDLKETAGLQIVRRCAQKVTVVFVVTGNLKILDLSQLDLPDNILLKSKHTPSGWLASDIAEVLNRGLVNYDRVFLIHGSDTASDGATGKVRKYLEDDLGLTVVLGDEVTLHGDHPAKLVEEMASCGGFVAICTPDDKIDDDFGPRANVLYEIGIAVGLSRGHKRLAILQKWGTPPDEQAVLPTDFSINIRFDRIENKFAMLKRQLVAMGMDIKDSRPAT